MANPKWDDTEEIPSSSLASSSTEIPSWDDTEDTPSELESGVRGIAQGASLGFADEITGGAEALWEVAKGNPEEFGRLYAKSRDESRRNYKASKEANPWSYGVGEVGGSVATAFVPGLNVAKGATLAARAGQAAALGGAAGLGTSEETTLGGLAKDAAIGAGLNAGFQGLGEKVIAPAISKIGSYTDDVAKSISAPDGKLNRGLAKIGSKLSGVDEDAALRQIQRPTQALAAEADDFTYNLGQKAVKETEALGRELGENVGLAGDDFIKNHGDTVFENAQQLPDKIYEFLARHERSQKGFSALSKDQIDELDNIAEILKGGDVTGEDLFKFRQYLDHVERLAGKYDQEGTGPFVSFLKSLRHDADKLVDKHDPFLDTANKAFSKYKTDTGVLRSATNESQAEGMINNLYGGNKKAKQDAASRLFTPATLESAQDIAANKAFEGAKRPGGDNYFRRGALAVLTSGVSEGVTSPWVWKKGLRGVGRMEEAIRTNPQMFGKYANTLTSAIGRGQTGLAATHFILSQQDPDYREMMTALEEQGEEEQ